MAPPALKLPKMGLGCWAWSDSLFWGYNPKQDADLEEVFDYATSKHAPALFDTAELYGLGRSETLLGDFSKTIKHDGDVIMATQFAVLP
jgi:pyridoxine 4-dehydrogenase